jgi:hypothetical protein
MNNARTVSFSFSFPIKLICLVLPIFLLGTILAGAASTDDAIATLKAQKNDAIFKVQDIVNQPITHLKRTPEMSDVAFYSPGWFHEGALTPDFANVDVRTSQQLVYEGHEYVTSDLNPGEVFLASELEFNPMTKYFYTDRSLPKKKLTEAEMLQINDLYRIIGHCNQQLDELQNPDPPLVKIQKLVTAHRPAVIAAVVGILALLIIIRKITRPKYEK